MIEESLLRNRLLDIYQRVIIKLAEAEPKEASDLAAEARTTALYIMRLESEGLKFMSELKKDKDVAKKLGLISMADGSDVPTEHNIEPDQTVTTDSDSEDEFKKQAVF